MRRLQKMFYRKKCKKFQTVIRQAGYTVFGWCNYSLIARAMLVMTKRSSTILLSPLLLCHHQASGSPCLTFVFPKCRQEFNSATQWANQSVMELEL